MKNFMKYVTTLLISLSWLSIAVAQQYPPPVSTATLQTAASTGNGTEMNVSGYSVVTLAIIGSSGADRVVTFEGYQDSTASFAAILCSNV